MKALLGSIGWFAVTVVTAAPARSADSPLEVTQAQLELHRLAGLTHIRSPGAREGNPADVALDIIVDEAGAVVSALPSPQWRGSGVSGGQWLAQAQAATRRWRFRRFGDEGGPVSVRSTVHFAVLPPERPPAFPVAFPQVSRERVSISLVREGCGGACPDYSVMIHGDGRVSYDGRGETLIQGVHAAAIPVERVERLIERFRAAGFWSLDAAYRAPFDYGAERLLTFVAGGESKTVVDYFGARAGMPDVVSELQLAVDEAADTARWVEGSEQTLQALAAEGFDFRSPEAADLLVRSIGRAPDSVAFGLIDRGAPLDAPSYCHGCWEDSAHEAALLAAVVHGRPEIFDRLVTEALLVRMAEAQRDELLLAAARVRSPHLIERMLAAGARMSASTYGGGSALLHALNNNWELASDADLEAVVRLLLARGADIAARDGIEWTAIQHAYDEDPKIVRILLEAGADVNAGAPGGHPILYLTSDEEIALIALAAGADRTLRDMDGRTLSEIARRNGWRRVEAMLNPGPG